MWLGIYLLGSAIALGSATAAFLHGEEGISGILLKSPNKKILIAEVIIASLLSWITVGFCQVKNAYRSSGNAGFTCGIK